MKTLLIDDDISLCKVLAYQLEKKGHHVISANSGKKGIEHFYNNEFEIVISDIRMPDISGIEVLQEIRRKNKDVIIILITAHGSVEDAIDACHFGADDYLTKPFGQEQLIFTIEKAVRVRKLQQENLQLRSQLLDKSRFKNIIGSSRKMKEALRQTMQVAQTDATVLIEGESGTGKELIAQAIHYNSPRKDKSFIAVNCPSIPHNLLESELFGHVKGAFTGAIKDRAGKFEQAEGGSIFLDEIGDLPKELQAKLLRVLQEQTIERLGDSNVKKVDVRIISATNRDLVKLVNSGKFREDLYFRIAVVPVKIPPLRERKEDIPLLLNHFVKKYAKNKKISFEPGIIDILQNYHWQGNVRELENVIERMIVFLENDRIRIKDIPEYIIKNKYNGSQLIKSTEKSGSLDQIQKEAILNALENSKGNKSRAARILGIPRHVLLYKIKKYDI